MLQLLLNLGSVLVQLTSSRNPKLSCFSVDWRGCIVSLILNLTQQLLKLRSWWNALLFCIGGCGHPSGDFFPIYFLLRSTKPERQLFIWSFCSKQFIYSQKRCILFARSIFTIFYPWGPVLTSLYIRKKTSGHYRWKEIIPVQMSFFKSKHYNKTHHLSFLKPNCVTRASHIRLKL